MCDVYVYDFFLAHISCSGTVCIGTFGLRGSVSDDNAAAAIETAKLIVVHLHNIGLRASIGE